MTMENFTKNITAEYILEAEPFRMILRPADPKKYVDIDDDLRVRRLPRLTPLEIDYARPLSWISAGHHKSGRERHLPALNHTVHQYLIAQEGKVPTAWCGPDDSRRLCELLGPGFPKRWKVAMRYAFEQPMHEMLGSRVVRNTCLHWPRGVMDYDSLMFLVKHRTKLQQIVQDGYGHFIPLIQQYWVWALAEDQPLQAIRATLGKGVWKTLCAQRPSRVVQLARVAQQGWHPNAYVHYRARQDTQAQAQWIRDILAPALHLPTTLLLNKNISALRAAEVGYLANLARRKPWPYAADGVKYIRTAQLWEYLHRELGAAVGMDWSPRRVEEEHRVLVERRHAEHMRRMLERKALVGKPFNPPSWVPLGLTHRDSRLTARLLTSAEAYVEQGQNQGHCVGSYAEGGAMNKYFVYSIEEADTPEDNRLGAICSTVMYNENGGMVQHYGKYNAIVTDPAVIALFNELSTMMKKQAPQRELATAGWNPADDDEAF
jgi:hypothetical protein